MDKQLIVRNTFVLIATVLTFISAQFYLGADNIILSIVVFLIALFILNKDFTGSPIRIFFKILSLTLFIGVVPYIANLNMFAGFPINFLAIFILLYLLVYRLKKSIYFPFLLGYTLLLCVSPKDLNGFSLRIGALVVIAIVSFIIQITINRRRSYKNKQTHLTNLLDIIYNLADDVIYEKNINVHRENFIDISKKWTNEIFETRNNNFYLNKKEDIELNIISSLEKLKLDFIHMNSNISEDLEFVFKLKQSLCILKKYAVGKINTTKLNSAILNSNFLIEEDILDHHILYEIQEGIIILKNLLIELNITDNEKFGFKEKTHDLLEFFKILKGHFNTNSVRFTFAFRTALTISTTYFLIQYFHIQHGSWIIYTIASVSQPYNDTLNKRGFHRVKGTVLGAILFMILFTIFRNQFERYIILMLTVYVNSFMKTYDKQITYITLLVLGLASMTDPNATILSFTRIYLVIIGVIITLVSGKIIFPYYISKETRYLICQYHSISELVIDKLLSITKDEKNRQEIKNQILLAKSIENKILINNTALDNKLLSKFLYEERYLLIKVQSILNRIEYADLSLQDNRDYRLEKLNEMRQKLSSLKEEELLNEEIPQSLIPYFIETKKTSEFLIYRDILEILINANTCTNLKEQILHS
ncbi:MAG: FUSC family protein [Sarcina sp.]